MNYQKIYNSIIDRAKTRDIKTIVGYHEKHHIIPKSMGGTDDKSNIVLLTAREHYLSHWLLFKIHRNKEMAAALHSMNQGNKYQKHRYVRSSRAYQESREFLSNHFSGERNPSKRPEVRKKISNKVSGEKNGMYGMVGELNPFYGKTHSNELIRKMQLSYSSKILVINEFSNEEVMFDCVSDCACHFGCTTKNILFRIKQNKPAKSGIFKNIKIKRIE